MGNRLQLQTLFENIMSELGYSNNEVYFQPPPSVQMRYPAIVYSLKDITQKFANDKLYLGQKAYSVTVIDKNPDSDIPNEILKFPLCDFSSFFISENLNHWNFTLYF